MEDGSERRELVERIADCILSTTGGVDSYMGMRTVCPEWRKSITKPASFAAFTDHHFRPRHWVMLDLKSTADDARLFLHTVTGRFRRVRLPVLRDHIVLGTSDGLIVLRDKEHPRLAGVLNPLTGDMLRFAAPLLEHIESEDDLYIEVSGGPHPKLLVWGNWEWRWNTIVYADPTSPEFREQEEIGLSEIDSMVIFQGNIYYTGSDEGVFEFLAPAEQGNYELAVIAKMSLDVEGDINPSSYARSYLVESVGELLLVCHRDEAFKVFRVNLEHKLLEEVKSIGGYRALFLGDERCVSVDADKLPSVDGDCIYMFSSVTTSNYTGFVIHMYNLRDNTTEIISIGPRLRANNHPNQFFHDKPMKLADPPDGDYHWPEAPCQQPSQPIFSR